uniref:Eclosion hormone n=1 Tax=Culicoides sonorensis TaxID=179676 RepID=A0A336MWM7_CULSO
MAKSSKLAVIVAVVILSLMLTTTQTEANPGLDLMGGFDFLGVCIRNCAQCKKMFGNYFEGERCAEACVKFKGKIIPDCEDIASIAPFLNKIEA